MSKSDAVGVVVLSCVALTLCLAIAASVYENVRAGQDARQCALDCHPFVGKMIDGSCHRAKADGWEQLVEVRR